MTNDYLRFFTKYGPVDKLDTPTFLLGPRIADEFQVCLEPGEILLLSGPKINKGLLSLVLAHPRKHWLVVNPSETNALLRNLVHCVSDVKWQSSDRSAGFCEGRLTYTSTFAEFHWVHSLGLLDAAFHFWRTHFVAPCNRFIGLDSWTIVAIHG